MARDDEGLIAEDLLACYRLGVFPMGETRNDPRIFIVDPDERGIIDPAAFHVPRRLARTVRSDRFHVTIDLAFDEVVRACAAPGPGRPETWINAPIRRLYTELNIKGFAHSLETRRDGRLVGGLYGVSLGGAFFGESMFSLERDASKVALVHLVARLRAGGYTLLDCQFLTSHLARFGTQEVPRSEYRARLGQALAGEGRFFALPRNVSGAQALDRVLTGDQPGVVD